MDPYYGEIRIFAGAYAPQDWLFCNGQILPIQQYNVLYTVLGTIYGGDGINTFGLPNLQGIVPMHQGTGLGLTPRIIGKEVGETTNTLTIDNLPNHIHSINANSATGNSDSPTGNIFAARGKNDNDFTTSAPNVNMNAAIVGVAGGIDGINLPVSNMQPYLAINYIICVSNGIYPVKSE